MTTGSERDAGQLGGIGRGPHDRLGHDAAHARGLHRAAPSARSASSITSVATNGSYSRATPTTDASWPSSRSRRSAGPLSAAPAMMGETATARSRRRSTASRIAGNGQHRPDRHDRIARRDDDRCRRTRSRPSRPARDAPRRRRRTARPTRPRRVAGERSTPGSPTSTPPSSGSVTKVRSRSLVAGSSCSSSPHAWVISAVTVAEVGSLGQPAGAIQVGAEVLVAEVEPALAPEAIEHLHRRPGLTGRVPSPVRDRWHRRGCR